jgi:2-amino-4-hydroxy-6-hydroxymethyldihydropteridine diphosphokinase
VQRLGALGRVAAVSSLYETAPVGGPQQGHYLNAVILLDTTATAREVLGRCLTIERERGRERTERWAARTLDLDVLVAGEERIDEPGLVVPHPRLAERRFVLVPLAEVWTGPLPDGRLPAELAERVADQDVQRVAGPGWEAAGLERSARVVLFGLAPALALALLAAVWRRLRTR